MYLATILRRWLRLIGNSGSLVTSPNHLGEAGAPGAAHFKRTSGWRADFISGHMPREKRRKETIGPITKARRWTQPGSRLEIDGRAAGGSMDRRAGVKRPCLAVRGLDGDHMAYSVVTNKSRLSIGPVNGISATHSTTSI